MLVEENRGDPRLFETSEGPVRVKRNDETGLTREKLTTERLLFELNRLIRFYGIFRGQQVMVKAPRDLAVNMLAATDNELPFLNRIVRHPIFDRTGRLVMKRGYDVQSQILLDIPAGLKRLVEHDPDNRTIRLSLRRIQRLFSDFPLKEEADFANLLAALLQVFVQEFDRRASAAIPNG